MSVSPDSAHPRRRRILFAVSAIVLLLVFAVGTTWWLSRPRGPVAEHLRGHSWHMNMAGKSVGRLYFHDDGRLTQTVPQGQVHGEWSVRDGKLVLGRMSRWTSAINHLFGQSPPVARYDVLEMTDKAVSLKMGEFQGQKLDHRIELTRIAE